MHSSPFRYFGHHRRVSNSVFSKLLTLLRILDGCEQPGMQWTGGRGGIRTHGTLAGTPVFKTGALNHSATLPVG